MPVCRTPATRPMTPDKNVYATFTLSPRLRVTFTMVGRNAIPKWIPCKPPEGMTDAEYIKFKRARRLCERAAREPG